MDGSFDPRAPFALTPPAPPADQPQAPKPDPEPRKPDFPPMSPQAATTAATAWAQENAGRVASKARANGRIDVWMADAVGPAYEGAFAAYTSGFTPDAEAIANALYNEIRGGWRELDAISEPGRDGAIARALVQATDLAQSGDADMDARYHGGGWIPPRSCVQVGVKRGTGRDGVHRRCLDHEFYARKAGQMAFEFEAPAPAESAPALAETIARLAAGSADPLDLLIALEGAADAEDAEVAA